MNDDDDLVLAVDRHYRRQLKPTRWSFVDTCIAIILVAVSGLL